MADDIRPPLLRWAGKILTRYGGLTADPDCCCCSPAFFMRMYEFQYDGAPDIPDPIPRLNDYYNGPGKGTCVFEIAQTIENCVSTAGYRILFIFIGMCCPTPDENTFFADHIDPAVIGKFAPEPDEPGWPGASSWRYTDIYPMDCSDLSHDTWPQGRPPDGLVNPYPPMPVEPCPDGYFELTNTFALNCEQMKRQRKCCSGAAGG